MGIMNWISNNKKLINMKKLITLFLISNFGFCQDIDHIKKLDTIYILSLIHISEPTRLGMISYAVFCLKKKTEAPASALRQET